MDKHGHLIILSGPSGAGKGTLRKELFEALPELVFSVSCTTRQPRPGERDGVDYHFICREKFDSLVGSDSFLEWAAVHGNCYGTRREDVVRELDNGRTVILEIDVQGSRQVKANMPDAVRIFITVPSLDELECRLDDRGTETPEKLMLRLKNAIPEMQEGREYDYIIVNDYVDVAAKKLIKLVHAIMSENSGGRS